MSVRDLYAVRSQVVELMESEIERQGNDSTNLLPLDSQGYVSACKDFISFIDSYIGPVYPQEL